MGDIGDEYFRSRGGGKFVVTGEQPIYNENITSTLPPVSSLCVPGPQQTIENTIFPLNMNSINPSQSEILSFDIPGYKIIIIPTFSQQNNTCLNYSSSDNTNTQFTQFQQ
ncbi:hypothetical protein GLOIN_2v1775756 [Rhizophagus irregularis DAOM 181602=DAOM 197198]|uniref:Uncharacterized protein n=1 Tax=Rhizophagus irregularis (strain DAOM 181602 / DAOM 197198 / MUCL 43194) TaxID=747089 RepID=A0A2P4PYM8_RHIID|nr:hypothetical protein GLOIN_2v1775756 [Rhizophagus irregularis DAOM 181602=DAOM 197198]POG70470.1 hypothetical protein GLOIN_2v1775756 [Rhizophagus irregularis DAOM 181602=DAOM 197198]GBC27692.2 hypothetical protein GLOIN_2v1775756 [Rhizophagus irregularis DAOM 181602=DAOM 197198]|eukprot:XP_025177336.1 hypothetical protein GLOIN_2v1775756 [Rhizophagus irregularis DAOM 181602=DAOM 197198]